MGFGFFLVVIGSGIGLDRNTEVCWDGGGGVGRTAVRAGGMSEVCNACMYE